MTIETHQIHLPFSESMRDFVDQKIRAKLRRHVDRVGRVVVRLADGPHGGNADKVCKVRVELENAEPIVAVGESRDVYTAILDAASRLVKPGGGLIYATCSVLPAENEKQIASFLETHPDFSVVPVSDLWRDVIMTEAPPQIDASPYLRLSPLQHGTDGFFAAALVRKEKEPAKEEKQEQEKEIEAVS